MEQWGLTALQGMDSQEPALATTLAGTVAWPWLQLPSSGPWESLSKATSGKGQPSHFLSLPRGPESQQLNLQDREGSQAPDNFFKTH